MKKFLILALCTFVLCGQGYADELDAMLNDLNEGQDQLRNDFAELEQTAQEADLDTGTLSLTTPSTSPTSSDTSSEDAWMDTISGEPTEAEQQSAMDSPDYDPNAAPEEWQEMETGTPEGEEGETVEEGAGETAGEGGGEGEDEGGETESTEEETPPEEESEEESQTPPAPKKSKPGFYGIIPAPGQGGTSHDGEDIGTKITQGTISLNDIPFFIVYLIDFVTKIGGTIAVIFVMVGGVQLMASGISENKEGAKNTIKYAIIGLIVSLLAWVIVAMIQAWLTAG